MLPFGSHQRSVDFSLVSSSGVVSEGHGCRITDLSFDFVVDFICAHLRAASLGIIAELGHRLIIVLEMARVRQ